MSLSAELRYLDRTRVLFEGRSYLFFAGTDYHRLSSHPEVVRAFTEAAWAEGLSCCGSRVTTGNHPLLVQLEDQATRFLGGGSVVLCSSGYLANTVALETLRPDYQRFFMAEGVHPSLETPAESLPPDRLHRFPGADPRALAEAMRAHLQPNERPLLLTEGVLAGDGALPPLAEYWEVLRPARGTLLVDDSHGIGVVGATGKGSPELAGLPDGCFVQTGTFSKAFGAFGGLVHGPEGFRDRVAERSRAFIGATPIPPPMAAAGSCALQLLIAQPELITGLPARMARIRAAVAALGLPASHSPAPILSVTHGDTGRNLHLRDLLLAAGIYPSYINYPGCPPGGHFRFTFSSAHTDPEIDRLLAVLAQSWA